MHSMQHFCSLLLAILNQQQCKHVTFSPFLLSPSGHREIAAGRLATEKTRKLKRPESGEVFTAPGHFLEEKPVLAQWPVASKGYCLAVRLSPWGQSQMTVSVCVAGSTDFVCSTFLSFFLPGRQPFLLSAFAVCFFCFTSVSSVFCSEADLAKDAERERASIY